MQIVRAFIRDVESRNPWVDGLRGVAILFVIICHYDLLGGLGGSFFGRTWGDIGNGAGYFGVTVFFVISGFLICSSTLRRFKDPVQIDCAQFWWFRFCRIMPLLSLAVFAVVVFHFFQLRGFTFLNTNTLLSQILGVLSLRFVEVMWADPTVGVWSPFWSLSVEECFYLAFPLVLRFSRGFLGLFPIAIVVIACGLFQRLVSPNKIVPLYSVMGCMDLLMLGVLVGFLKADAADLKVPKWLSIAAMLIGLAGILAGVIAFHPYKASAFMPFWSGCSTALFLGGAVLGQPAGVGFLWPFRILGFLSYELYLVHNPLASALTGMVQRSNPLLWFLLFCIVFVVNRLFTEPVNACLRQLSLAPSQDRPRRPEFFRKCLLPTFAAAASVVVAAFLLRMAPSQNYLTMKLSEIAELPSGRIEPVAAIGVPGSADLVFLKHIGAGKAVMGIDHSGKGGGLSLPFDLSEIQGKQLVLKIVESGVSVHMGEKTLVSSSEPAFHPRARVSFGVNELGYKEVMEKAASRIAGVSP